MTYFKVQEELTEFAMTGDHTAWWIPGDYSTQEFVPTESKLSQVRELQDVPRPAGGSPQTKFSQTGVQTALQMKTADGLYINIHEAEVLDYPTTNLDLDDKNFVFTTHPRRPWTATWAPSWPPPPAPRRPSSPSA